MAHRAYSLSVNNNCHLPHIRLSLQIIENTSVRIQKKNKKLSVGHISNASAMIGLPLSAS